MKHVRMLLTGAIVIAIVGGALAFKTPNRNLFQCVSGFCVNAPYSDIIVNPVLGDPQLLYKMNNHPSVFDCPNPDDPSVGCFQHPQKAYRND